MILRPCFLVLFWIVAWLALPARAQPPLIVVADHGGTPALPYYASLGLAPLSPVNQTPPEQSAPGPGSGRPVSFSPSHRRGIESANFTPVRSPRLTPGPAARRAASFFLTQPFFLVGDDPLSRRWLRERHETLIRLRAVGLVVDVDTEAALQSLRQRAPGIPLSPVPGDDLAERLKLTHYPVLITADGIMP